MARRPVDLAAVRESRDRLAALAREHPHLVAARGESSASVADWIETLSTLEETMNEAKKQVAFRLPESLIARIDAFAEQCERERPGLSVNRTEALVILLMRALDAEATGARS
jgi:hypothetical protein